MALPLPYRPKGVIEFIAEAEKDSILKLKVDKKKIFVDRMIFWYKNLAKSQKSKLTKKKLYQRAIIEAHRLELPEFSVPPDWVKILVKECDLVLFISKKSKKRRDARREAKLLSEIEPSAATREVPPLVQTGVKKFIDLTSEAPPDEWTIAKLRGEKAERYLAMHTTADSNIIYWDYDTTHWKIVPRDPKEALTETTRQTPSQTQTEGKDALTTAMTVD